MPLDAEQFTIIGLLVTAILSNLRGDWYSAKAFNQMRAEMLERYAELAVQNKLLAEDRDYYKNLAIGLLQNNARALKLVDQTTTKR